MGLLLSVLVFSVGVIEALSCYNRFRSGYLPLNYQKARQHSQTISDFLSRLESNLTRTSLSYPSDVTDEEDKSVTVSLTESDIPTPSKESELCPDPSDDDFLLDNEGADYYVDYDSGVNEDTNTQIDDSKNDDSFDSDYFLSDNENANEQTGVNISQLKKPKLDDEPQRASVGNDWSEGNVLSSLDSSIEVDNKLSPEKDVSPYNRNQTLEESINLAENVHIQRNQSKLQRSVSEPMFDDRVVTGRLQLCANTMSMDEGLNEKSILRKKEKKNKKKVRFSLDTVQICFERDYAAEQDNHSSTTGIIVKSRLPIKFRKRKDKISSVNSQLEECASEENTEESINGLNHDAKELSSKANEDYDILINNVSTKSSQDVEKSELLEDINDDSAERSDEYEKVKSINDTFDEDVDLLNKETETVMKTENSTINEKKIKLQSSFTDEERDKDNGETNGLNSDLAIDINKQPKQDIDHRIDECLPINILKSLASLQQEPVNSATGKLNEDIPGMDSNIHPTVETTKGNEKTDIQIDSNLELKGVYNASNVINANQDNDSVKKLDVSSSDYSVNNKQAFGFNYKNQDHKAKQDRAFEAGVDEIHKEHSEENRDFIDTNISLDESDLTHTENLKVKDSSNGGLDNASTYSDNSLANSLLYEGGNGEPTAADNKFLDNSISVSKEVDKSFVGSDATDKQSPAEISLNKDNEYLDVDVDKKSRSLKHKRVSKSKSNIPETEVDVDSIQDKSSTFNQDKKIPTRRGAVKSKLVFDRSVVKEEKQRKHIPQRPVRSRRKGLKEGSGTESEEEWHVEEVSDGVETESDNEAAQPSTSYETRRQNTPDDKSLAEKAFWLIFSGEYTKAMSKDWHSSHFCCWQCDESLTGQRYVLRDDHPYCIKCYESVFANSCEECSRVIGIDSKDLSYKDKHWHEACFLCSKCRVSLVDKQFGSKADKIYCGNCYDAQFASRCDGCGQIFRAGTKKMEYKTRQWHEQCFCCCVCKTPIGTKSFIPREQEIYCATCYEEKFATRCVKCNKIITSGGVTYKNEPWHRECFTCTNCGTSLAGQRFTSREDKPYCADCFGELFAKRCTACCKPITGIGGTRFISFEDRHWHNDCFICASCKTSLVGRGFITDGDDIICPECAKQKLM